MPKDTYKVSWTEPAVDDVRQEPHHVLHLEAKLLEMFPLFGLLPIIHKDIRLGWIGGGPNANPTGAQFSISSSVRALTPRMSSWTVSSDPP